MERRPFRFGGEFKIQRLSFRRARHSRAWLTLLAKCASCAADVVEVGFFKLSRTGSATRFSRQRRNCGWNRRFTGWTSRKNGTFRLCWLSASALVPRAREVHYPSSAGKKLSHRARCDLVLTPQGHPLEPAKLPEQNLFTLASGEADVQYCPPADALWLEVKIAYQFREGGARHKGYGAQWRQQIISDLQKMEAEPLIHEAGLVLIVSTSPLKSC
jgi:hypothetical protein